MMEVIYRRVITIHDAYWIFAFVFTVVNNSALEIQGCYDDSDVTPDLLYKVTAPDFVVNPRNCIDECYLLGYQFAGTKISTVKMKYQCGLSDNHTT